MDKPVVGFVGVGLMGWGMAKNAVGKGWPLRVVAHRKREAVDDLVARGARECASLAEMAAEVDVVVLCVTGSPQVEAVLAEMVPAARPGLTVIDSTTSDPEVTERLAAVMHPSALAEIYTCRQAEPLGMGHAVSCAEAHVGRQPFAVLLGDEFVEADKPVLPAMLELQARTGGVVMAFNEVDAWLQALKAEAEKRHPAPAAKPKAAKKAVQTPVSKP